MNFPFRKSIPDNRKRGDDAVDMEWLGGEAWVTPPPVSIESFGAVNDARSEDAAPEWMPL